MAIAPDAGHRARRVHKGIVGWNGAVVIDAVNLAKRRIQPLGVGHVAALAQGEEEMALVIEQKARAVMDHAGCIKPVGRLEDVLLVYPFAIGVDVGAHDTRHGRRQARAVFERSGWRQRAFVARQHFGIRKIDPGTATPVVGVHRDVEKAAILPRPME